MKNLRVIPSLVATLLLVSGAVAQTGGPAADEPSGPSEIAAARSKYLEKAADAATTKDSQAEAQLPRRGPRMPMPLQRRYYGGAYSTPWMPNGDAGHALIGAGIGFAIGATIGAAGAVHNGTSVGNGVALGGSLCALFGLAIAATHGLGHPYMYRRRIYTVPPEDDAEGNLRAPAIQKNSPAKLPASRNPGLSSQQREVEANAAGAPEMSEGPEQPSEGAVSSPKTQH